MVSTSTPYAAVSTSRTNGKSGAAGASKPDARIAFRVGRIATNPTRAWQKTRVHQPRHHQRPADKEGISSHAPRRASVAFKGRRARETTCAKGDAPAWGLRPGHASVAWAWSAQLSRRRVTSRALLLKSRTCGPGEAGLRPDGKAGTRRTKMGDSADGGGFAPVGCW